MTTERSDSINNTITRRLPKAFAAFAHRNFALFIAGQTISLTGTWMHAVALGWLVFDLTGSKSYLGIVGALNTAPTLLVTLPAGVLADRYEKRKIIIATQSLAALQAFAIFALVWSGTVEIWHILALSLFNGLIMGVDVPTRHSIIVELSSKDMLLNAVAINSAVFNGTRIAGPAVAGLVIASFGTDMCFLINALSYLAIVGAMLMIRIVRKVQDNKAGIIAQAKEGLRYAKTHVVTRDLLLMTGVMSFFVLQYGVILPAFAKEVLDVGPSGYGYMMSSLGLGAFIAAISIASVGHLVGQDTLARSGSIIAPVAMIGFGLFHYFWIECMLLVAVGFGMMTFLAVSNTIMQGQSPDELRGRVMSVRSFVFFGSMPLGALSVGFIAETIGVWQSVVLSGSICLLFSIYFVVHAAAKWPARLAK